MQMAKKVMTKAIVRPKVESTTDASVSLESAADVSFLYTSLSRLVPCRPPRVGIRMLAEVFRVRLL